MTFSPISHFIFIHFPLFLLLNLSVCGVAFNSVTMEVKRALLGNRLASESVFDWRYHGQEQQRRGRDREREREQRVPNIGTRTVSLASRGPARLLRPLLHRGRACQVECWCVCVAKAAPAPGVFMTAAGPGSHYRNA